MEENIKEELEEILEEENEPVPSSEESNESDKEEDVVKALGKLKGLSILEEVDAKAKLLKEKGLYSDGEEFRIKKR